MLKKLLLAMATLVASMGFAFAQVDVNKADQAALDGIKGIGPKMSQNILDERKKGGAFRDWTDLESRVKGVGEKSAVKLSDAGLTVNSQARPKAAASAAADVKKTKADAKKDVQAAKKDDSKK
ncbi:MAG: ComEA family DNA-binding protein [Noviherbaspirillum sp.]